MKSRDRAVVDFPQWYDSDSLSSYRLHQAYVRVRENPAGDGNRVQSVVTDGSQTITTVSIGSYYEQITT